MAKEVVRSEPLTVEQLLSGDVQLPAALIDDHPVAEMPFLEEEDEDELNDNIERALAAAGLNDDKSAFINVYRVTDNGDVYLKRFEIKDFKLDTILNLYGSGKYRCVGYRTKDSGRGVRLFMRKETTLEAPKEKPVNDNPIDMVKELMKQQQEQFQQMLMMQQKPQQSTDVIALLKIAKDLFQPSFQPVQSQAPMEQMTQMLSMFKLMKEFVGESNATASESLMTKGLELISPILQKGLEQQLNNDQNQHSMLANPQLTNEEPQPMPLTNQQNPQVEALNRHINVLIIAAEKNSDVGLYADLVLDTINNDDEALKIVSDEQIWGNIVLIPGVQKNLSWFQELRKIIKEILTEGEKENISENNSPQNSLNHVAKPNKPNI